MSFANLFRWAWNSMFVSRHCQPTEPSCESPGTPSVCFNRMSIKGSRSALERLRRAAGGCDPTFRGVGQYNDFCFNSVLPIPDLTLKEVRCEQSLIKLSEARFTHWQVGSNALGVQLKENPHELLYSFCSYANPPRILLNELIKRFPELKFRIEFANDREGFRGIVFGKRGESYWRDSRTYTETAHTRAFR